VRSLARNGLTVHAIVNSPQGQSAHSNYTASAWMVDARPHESGFADEILSLVDELDVGSIMPVSEGYHNALISLYGELEKRDVHLFSPSREQFDQSTDKDYLQTLCLELGIPVAKGMRLNELMDQDYESVLEFPLVLRTRRQNIDAGKVPVKAAYAENIEQLLISVERFYLEKL
jgi:predicted ATP-grasp superfamily ATP-dependent carboligase